MTHLEYRSVFFPDALDRHRVVRVRLSEAQRGGFGGGPASAETLTLTASATTRQRHIASSERFSVRLEATKIRLRNFYEVPSRRHGFANFDERSSIASSSPLLLASLAVWFGELRSPHASCGFASQRIELRSLRRHLPCPPRRSLCSPLVGPPAQRTSSASRASPFHATVPAGTVPCFRCQPRKRHG